MLTIGLTGGIGSGKSLIATFFKDLGIPILDADVIARELTLPHLPLYHDILHHFSRRILKENGEINRAALRDIIFSYPQERAWLENLLHPAIISCIQKQLPQLHGPYVIVVIPLLLEIPKLPFIDRILVVDCDEMTQIQRVQVRDKLDLSLIEAILKTQIPRKIRLNQANEILINNGTITDILPQIKNLHEFYLKLSGKE